MWAKSIKLPKIKNPGLNNSYGKKSTRVVTIPSNDPGIKRLINNFNSSPEAGKKKIGASREANSKSANNNPSDRLPVRRVINSESKRKLAVATIKVLHGKICAAPKIFQKIA